MLVKSRTWWHQAKRTNRGLMTITLEAPNVTRHGAYFIGARSRLATVTAVDFIDKELLVATHFLGQKMFLIHQIQNRLD